MMGAVSAGRSTTDGLQAGCVLDFSGSAAGTVTPINDDGSVGAPIFIATQKIIGPYPTVKRFRIDAPLTTDITYTVVSELDSRIINAIGNIVSAGSVIAVGDGVTDDTDVIERAGSGGATLTLGGTKSYRITRNITLPKIQNKGAFLYIDEGITVSGDVDGPDDVPFVKGPGRFVASNGFYSSGWFDGATFDIMHDAMTRGWEENKQKNVVWPAPLPHVPSFNAVGQHKLANPIIWDGKHNLMRLDPQCGFFCTSLTMTCAIEVSTTLKIEDVEMLGGLIIDCGSNAEYGVISHGGSRLFMKHKNIINRPRKSGILFIGQTSPLIADTSESEIDFLECSKFGVAALELQGLSATAIIGLYINRIFSNGARCIWGTAVVSGGILTGININPNGPNGLPQDLTGHGWAGEELFVFGKPGVHNGYGAKATVAANGFGVAQSLTVTDAGSGVGNAAFTNGNVVCCTAAESYIKIRGTTRNCGWGRVLEVQDDNANLCPPAFSIVDIKSTSQGASQKFRVGTIETTTGRRPLLDVGDLSGGSAAKNSIDLEDIASINTIYDGGAYVRLSWCDTGSVRLGTEIPGTTPLIKIDHTVSNMDFYGVPMNRIIGGLNATNAQMFGFRNTFHGAYGARVQLDKDQVLQVPLPPSMNGRAFIQNQQDNAGYADINIRATSVINQLSKGASAVLTTGVLAGTTGADGSMNISLSGNILYIENRTATGGTIRDFTVRVNID